MPKIQFIENKFIEPPYIHPRVSFDNFGEIKEVPEDVATVLLTDHPDKFRAIDNFAVKAASETTEGELVRIKFLRNDFLEEYHSADVDFDEPGQVKAVKEEVARYLLTEHPDKFALAEVPKEAQSDSVDEKKNRNGVKRGKQ